MDIRKLTEEQRRDLYVAVFSAACKVARGKQAARDLTQQAFLRLDTTSPWTPGGTIGLEQHLYGILKSLRSNEAATDAKRRKYERLAAEEHAVLSDAGRSAEAIILDDAERERAEALAVKRVAKLRARLAALGLDLDLQILDGMIDDVTRRADLVERTGRSLAEVKTALARIRRHMDSILAAERGEDEEVK